MSRKQFTTLTSQGKQYLLKSNPYKQVPQQSSLSQKQNKFLQHFQSINNVDPLINTYSKSAYNTENNQALYYSKLQSYSQSKISQIERIIRGSQDQINIKSLKNHYKLSKPLPIIHVKPQIKKNVQRINSFFDIQHPKLSLDQKKQQQDIIKSSIFEIGIYSQAIKILQFQHKQQIPPIPNQNQYPSIYNTPTERPYYDSIQQNAQGQSSKTKLFANSNSQTQRNPSYGKPQNQFANVSLNQSPSDIKIRKADMLLVQILREKKRKGLVSDYYKIMELKLFELLDFILTDQPQFQGLSSIQKMKEVLKKLDSFKGKKIEGQNKINLLKIFFEEFRNLKNEIAESQKKKPLQKVQNKPRQIKKQPVQRQPIQKQRRRQQPQDKWIKKSNTKETMSMAGDKKSRTVVEDKKNRSVKGMQDQWLGELQ